MFGRLGDWAARVNGAVGKDQDEDENEGDLDASE